MGINIAPEGVNRNDPGDGDSGPNDLVNYPVITSATTSTVRGTACAGCVDEGFVADLNPSGYGEGRTFVGSAVAGTDGTFTVSVTGVSGGQVLTATATDALGNTSEFARNVTVTGSTTLPAAPRDLTAQRTGPTSRQRIQLAWTDNATNETGFVLERAVGTTGSWNVLVQLAKNTTSYSDTSVQRATTYRYRIKAVNGAGSSAWSNVASVTTK